MAPTEKRFNAVDGVPLCYWRWTDGTAGRRVQQRTFHSTNAFYARLLAWTRDLRALSQRYGGLTGMNRIVTAGAYVNKPGQHGLGQAIDIDQVRWSNATITPYWREHASGNRAMVRRYLALDAVSRRHFRYVLDGGFNAAHADHLHLDFGGGAIRCDKRSRSDTAFVQMSANAFMGAGLRVDGAWGSRTQTWFTESQRRLGVGGNPHGVTRDWQLWLGRAAACGFAGTDFRPAPAPPDPLGELVEGLLGPLG